MCQVSCRVELAIFSGDRKAPKVPMRFETSRCNIKQFLRVLRARHGNELRYHGFTLVAGMNSVLYAAWAFCSFGLRVGFAWHRCIRVEAGERSDVHFAGS